MKPNQLTNCLSSVTVTSILRATTLNFSITSPDVTCQLNLFSFPNILLTKALDDIASTLWTMIEINVAIICACLPMCRMVLAWMLPGLFGSMTASGTPKNAHSSGSSDPTMTIGHRRLRSLNGEWAPYSGPTKPEAANHSSVHHHEETSEEFILAPYQKAYIQEDADGIIRKTTQYEVFYESEDSKAEKGQVKTRVYAT